MLTEGKKSTWVCTYHLYWPEEIKFLAEDTKKSLASHKAAIAALLWLKNNHKITNDGLPAIYRKEEVRTITAKTLPVLSLDESTVDKIQNIVNLHRTQIVPHIIQNRLDKAEKKEESEEESQVVRPLEDVNLKTARRQKYLGLDTYLAKEKVELPIAQYK